MQEQIDNGDLTARLDDARNLLRDRGVDAGRASSGHAVAVRQAIRPRGRDPRARTLPTGRRDRRRRKPPFAQISPVRSTTSHRSRTVTSRDRVARAERQAGTDPVGPIDDDLDHHSS